MATQECIILLYCPCCKTVKPVNDFHKSKLSKSGYKSWCRTCRNAGSRQYYSEHREEKQAYYFAHREEKQRYDKEYYAANHQKRLVQRRKYYQEHVEESRVRGKRYREYGSVTISAQRKTYRHDHREEISAQKKRYYEIHREEILAHDKEYRRNNKGKIQAAVRRRKARKKAVIVEIFLDREIFERDQWICQLCHKKVNRKLSYPDRLSASLDHIIPLSKDGEHSRKNCCLVHLRCNLSKGNRIVTQQIRLF